MRCSQRFADNVALLIEHLFLGEVLKAITRGSLSKILDQITH